MEGKITLLHRTIHVPESKLSSRSYRSSKTSKVVFTSDYLYVSFMNDSKKKSKILRVIQNLKASGIEAETIATKESALLRLHELITSGTRGWKIGSIACFAKVSIDPKKRVVGFELPVAKGVFND
jgi:hypothetical protein